jgi:hypothetical protein
MPTDRLGSACERPERDKLIFRIKKTVQLRATCPHPLGQFRFRQSLLFHKRVELACDHAFDGARRDLLVNALLFQKIVE